MTFGTTKSGYMAHLLRWGKAACNCQIKIVQEFEKEQPPPMFCNACKRQLPKALHVWYPTI